jgi:hypothetical protein
VKAVQNPITGTLHALEAQIFDDQCIFDIGFKIQWNSKTAGGSHLQRRVFAKQVWQGVKYAHGKNQQDEQVFPGRILIHSSAPKAVILDVVRSPHHADFMVPFGITPAMACL